MQDPTQDGDWLSAHLFFEGESAGDIYGEAADRVIIEVVAPVVRICQSKKWMQRFFFVRYSLDGPHVRLRILGDPEVLQGRVQPLILQQSANSRLKPGQDAPLVTHVEWTPYEPEVDRYGGPQGIPLAERFFHVSSQTALSLQQRIPPGERPARLGKGLLSTLVLLYVFTASRIWCSEMANSYGTNYLRAQVPDPEQQEAWLEAFEEGFDRQADKLSAYVEAAWDALETGEELTPDLDGYRDRLEEIEQRFRELFEKGQLLRDGQVLEDWRRAVGSIVPSYMHMMSNRLGVTIREESYLSVLIHRTLEVSRQDAKTAKRTD